MSWRLAALSAGGLLLWVWMLGCVCRMKTLDLGVQMSELLLHIPKEVGESGQLSCRVDCVLAHALPVIGRYPRGNASGTLWGFRPAPHAPPGVEVLHAKLAVIARRAYESSGHGLVGWRRRGRTRCLRRTAGAVPPVLRLCLHASHPRCTVPRAVSAMRAWVLGLTNAGPFLPIMGADFRLAACWTVRGLVTKPFL